MIKKYAGSVCVSGLILALCGCAPVTINSVPPGATVYSADGQTELGATPFDTSVVHRDKEFTVRQPGYFDETVQLDYNSARTVNVALKPAPIAVSSSPVAEIYPVGSAVAIGKTPLKLNVSAEEKMYTFKADGYYDQDIAVSIESPDPLVVTMARRPIVTLSATPSGTEVYEKGKRIGTAPIVEEIGVSRTFELRKENHFTRTITLAGAPPYEVSVDLKPFPVVTVAATPANATIYRDNKLLGKIPFSLPVGEKTDLEVRADRFYPQKVTLTPESKAQVAVSLKAMPFVTVNSEPAGAQVFIAGKSAGTTPVELLVEKTTPIEIRKEGFVTGTSSLTGTDKQVTVQLQAVPPPVQEEPAIVEPIVEKEEPVAEKPVVAEPVEEVAAETETPPPAGVSKLMVWSAAAVVAALAVFFLLKRKKQ